MFHQRISWKVVTGVHSLESSEYVMDIPHAVLHKEERSCYSISSPSVGFTFLAVFIVAVFWAKYGSAMRECARPTLGTLQIMDRS